MPQLSGQLRQKVDDAIDLARAGEMIRTAAGAGTAAWKQFHIARLELLYELALMRIFIEWEVFLEETFFRYLCGYSSAFGVATIASGTFFSRLADAEAAVLGSRPYVLWYNPAAVISRSQQFFPGSPGSPGSRHEIVVASSTARLQSIAAVRHRIVHGQKDARLKFDTATMLLCGKRYRGARPGRFLRDWDWSSTPGKRWLESIGDELCGLASQIA
jgi:hypothetical protein